MRVQVEAQRRQAERELKRVLSQKAAVQTVLADAGTNSRGADGEG